jgi:TolB-like protein
VPTVASVNRVVRFGPFQADLKSGELRRNGQRVRLQELPFQVLSLLLERHGDVVTREELRNKIWTADTFVDFDHGLNKAINKIRGALGDRPELPRYIETVSRRGYRFIAPVLAGTPQEAPAPLPKLRLAVLPFENLGEDPAQEYFSDGMTDEMIAQLGRLDPHRLGVIARTSAMQYKRTGKDIATIGRELGIDYIVEGSVRRAGNRVRIAAQLIKVSDQTHLWSESYEREMDDMLNLQNDVARRIGRSLALELLPEMTPGASSPGKLHPDAHEHYLRGRFLAMQRTETALLAGIECFERALTEDPDYAPAHAGLADCYSLLSWFGALRPHEAAPKARTAAQRALALDDKLGAAHCSLALMHFWYEWRWNDAERELRRAIELNPSYPAAHHWLGSFLSAMGRLDEAVEQHRLAIELDPLSLIIAKSIADPYYYGRQFEAAEQYTRNVLEREPRFAPGHFDLGRILLCRGNHAAAIEAFERAANISQNPSATTALAAAAAFAGQGERALQLLQEAQQGSVGRYLPSPLVAQVYLGLGDVDTAFEWMQKGIEERSYWLVLTRQDPLYDPFRRHPRFQTLLEIVGF